MLAGGDGDAEAFTTLESDSDSEESVASRYKSSHDTPNDPEDDELDGSSTPEPTEEVTSGFRDRQSPSKIERTSTPPAEEAKDCTPTPPAEKAEDRTPSPPKVRKEGDTQPEQPDEDYTMSYPYPKY